MKTFVVGDIHGGLRALKQVLERLQPHPKDSFIWVGDYVDGWSENTETIDFLMAFSKSYRCIFLRGNHDELCHNYLKDGKAPEMWLYHGGESTKKGYDKLPEVDRNQHLQFFEDLLNFHIDDQNRLYVHAGFTNMHGPQYEYYPNLVYWDRTLWEMACSLDPNLSKSDPLFPKRLTLFEEIFIGHTPVTRIGKNVPFRAANVWNVDTGAAFKGALTIMEVGTKAYWQSDPVHRLYPEESGRN